MNNISVSTKMSANLISYAEHCAMTTAATSTMDAVMDAPLSVGSSSVAAVVVASGSGFACLPLSGGGATSSTSTPFMRSM